MAYNEFTISKVKKELGITLKDKIDFIPENLNNLELPEYLQQYLAQSLDFSNTVASEKARSEFIISPILLELRRIYNKDISIFSGEEFNVDNDLGLNSRCDFIISASPEIYTIEAPIIIILEAKKLDIGAGLGQCIASMVAAQKFNLENYVEKYLENLSPTQIIYGCVSTGTIWKFIKLEDKKATINVTNYYLPAT